MKGSYRKTLLLLLLAALLAPALSSQAVKPRDMAYAYIVPSQAYLTVGEPVTFDLHLSEPSADYDFSYSFCRVTQTPGEEKSQLDSLDYIKSTKETTYTGTVPDPGLYVLVATITDKDYSSVELRTENMIAENPGAAEDATTVTGKVKALAAEVTALNLPHDYDRALWLHDWLIYNADYDESMTVHHPRGVLLDGTGVCESYAIAYQLLLSEIGIPSMYVTGYAGGDLHAWNLVQLDGEWYHIDCTWDDPIGGGNEGYGYFGLNDAMMGRDHDWERQNYVFPKATGQQYNYLLRNGAKQFASLEEMDKVLGEAVTNKETPIQYLYTGEEKYFGAMDQVTIWLKENKNKYSIDGWTQTGSRFSGKAEITYAATDGVHLFSDDAGMDAVLSSAMAAKENPISIRYNGDDRFYYLSTPLRNWLSANARKYYLKEYSYNYTDTSAEITVSYNNYTGYTEFADDQQLAHLLAAALEQKTTALKLYYTGTDEWYNLGTKLSTWQMENAQQVKQYYGSIGRYEADITIEYK
jgi:transglutaminase-like putative cysteine protease